MPNGFLANLPAAMQQAATSGMANYGIPTQQSIANYQAPQPNGFLNGLGYLSDVLGGGGIFPGIGKAIQHRNTNNFIKYAMAQDAAAKQELGTYYHNLDPGIFKNTTTNLSQPELAGIVKDNGINDFNNAALTLQNGGMPSTYGLADPSQVSAMAQKIMEQRAKVNNFQGSLPALNDSSYAGAASNVRNGFLPANAMPQPQMIPGAPQGNQPMFDNGDGQPAVAPQAMGPTMQQPLQGGVGQTVQTPYGFNPPPPVNPFTQQSGIDPQVTSAYDAGAKNSLTAQSQGETFRHNTATEGLTGMENREKMRHNRADEANTGYANATTRQHDERSDNTDAARERDYHFDVTHNKPGQSQAQLDNINSQMGAREQQKDISYLTSRYGKNKDGSINLPDPNSREAYIDHDIIARYQSNNYGNGAGAVSGPAKVAPTGGTLSAAAQKFNAAFERNKNYFGGRNY